MQKEEDNHRSDYMMCNVTPKKSQNTPRESFAKKNIMLQEIKRKAQYTPQNSPDNFLKTPSTFGSFRKDTKLLSEGNKRKMESRGDESVEQNEKTCPSGKFVNTMIGQWCKHMGVQTPSSQTAGEECQMLHETKRRRMTEEQMIQKLQKKLQVAEETISSLSTSHEDELRAKEEIMQQLNIDWETITKYYYEISENLKEFQEHKKNLSNLYNNVILVQQSTVKKMQEELSTMKLKDEEQRNVADAIENKMANQEKRIQEMITAEIKLKQKLEEMKKDSMLEIERLNSVHAKEKFELSKSKETLSSVNEELQIKLEKIVEEKENIKDLCVKRDEEVKNLQEEIFTWKNKIEDLSCQNKELNAKYSTSINKTEELSKELQLKIQEVDRLQENLSTRQDIEQSLGKDLTIIENKYKNMRNDFSILENKYREMKEQNAELESSMQETKSSSERKIVELNKKIEILGKEKERMLLEKRSKIQELEHDCETLKEKHKAEITSLKGEFDMKLSEMKRTIFTQNTVITKLNETLNKMNEENENMKASYNDRAKENRDKLQEISNEWNLRVREPNLSQKNEVHGIKERQFQSQEIRDKWKSSNKDGIKDKEQDIYNFETTEISDKFENLQQLSQTRQGKKARLDTDSPKKNTMKAKTETEKDQERGNEMKGDSSTQKMIFKSRSAGFRQYGTPNKLYTKNPRKTTKK